MKKFFSLVIALVATMAINATDYYVSGIGGWTEPGNKAEMLLQPQAGTSVRTITVARLEACEFKVFANAGWGGPEYGAANAGDAVIPNGAAYTMASPAQNLAITVADKHYIKDAVVAVDTANWTVTVTGTDVDASLEADVYCLVGACTDNWAPEKAIEFAEVNGVLTANVADLNGTFKIIKNHKWGWEAGAPEGAKMNANEAFTLTTSGAGNISFSNPFAGYLNAVLTLDVTNEDAPVLTLTGGTFNVFQADWHIAGTKTGWKCEADQRMTKIDDNHYEYLAAEFGADFKVVYGNWGVEFGAPKGDSTFVWEINKEIELATPCDNLNPADPAAVYTDVTITIEVNYEEATLKILLADANYTAVDNVATEEKATKKLINGQLVIEKDGVRYNALGARL